MAFLLSFLGCVLRILRGRSVPDGKKGVRYGAFSSAKHHSSAELCAAFHGAQRAVGDRAAAAADGHHARLDELLDAERLEHPDQSVELILVTGGLHRDHVDRDVDHPGAEQVHDLEHPRPALGVGPDLDQEQLALHGGARLELDDLEHVDELVQLLGHLLERVLLAVDHDSDAGELLVLGRPDRQRLDVEAAAGEQAGDPDQDARLVLDEHGQRVGHSSRPPQSGARPRANLMSLLDVPAATMGQTMASLCTMKSSTTGRSSMAMARSMTRSTSAASSQRRPSQPYASASLTKSGILVPVGRLGSSVGCRSVLE